MIDESDIETYLIISPKKYSISLFDKKNLKNLYNEQLNLNGDVSLDINKLSDFLDNNIFKIEKLTEKFLKNIFIIIQDEKVFNLDIGIKKKNYESKVIKKNFEVILTEAKDIFKENYQTHKIMHMIINTFYIDEKRYLSFENDLYGKSLCVEVKFLSIKENFTNQLEMTLKKFQIRVIKYLDGNYIKNFFENGNIEFSEMIYKINSGCNNNEITLVPKNHKNKGFFEKFFQLFS